MEFGIDNSSPLLTIAIPTWNRASSLDKALDHLLNQIEYFKKYIEVIISDNASSDNTSEIVNKHIALHPKMNIIHNRNIVNIHFYGNFKKCRELSSGKFMWLLSDDDFVCSHVVSELVENLKEKEDYAMIYLKNDISMNFFKKYIITGEQLIEKETYNIGLISSVIFLNDKENDKFLFNRYSNSPFIGFIFMLNSFNFKKSLLVLQGNCLLAANQESTANDFFEIFVNGMEHVIDYMRFINISKKIITNFRKSYLLNFIRPSYIIYKVEKKNHHKNLKILSLHDGEQCIKNRYLDLWDFWLIFYPFMLIPSTVLTFLLKFHRSFKNYKSNAFKKNFKN